MNITNEISQTLNELFSTPVHNEVLLDFDENDPDVLEELFGPEEMEDPEELFGPEDTDDPEEIRIGDDFDAFLEELKASNREEDNQEETDDFGFHWDHFDSPTIIHSDELFSEDEGRFGVEDDGYEEEDEAEEDSGSYLDLSVISLKQLNGLINMVSEQIIWNLGAVLCGVIESPGSDRL